jgi:exosortase/archaeosortase family protein
VLAFVIERPLWHKVAILASSIPIAVFSNVIRTLTTAWFIHWDVAPEYNERFHDVAGLAMMPLALLLCLMLLRFFRWLDLPSQASNARDVKFVAGARSAKVRSASLPATAPGVAKP